MAFILEVFEEVDYGCAVSGEQPCLYLIAPHLVMIGEEAAKNHEYCRNQYCVVSVRKMSNGKAQPETLAALTAA